MQTVQKPRSTKDAAADPEGFRPSDAPLPLRALLVRPVLLSVANYGLLSMLDIAYRAIQPLFFSTPIALGGLGQNPARIGVLLSSVGCVNGVIQGLFFPRLLERFGPRRLFLFGMGMFSAIYLLFPVINYVAVTQGLSPFVWVLVMVQLGLSIAIDLAYGESL
jgi:MFS family permease